jgi:hypothetical protein
MTAIPNLHTDGDVEQRCAVQRGEARRLRPRRHRFDWNPGHA